MLHTKDVKACSTKCLLDMHCTAYQYSNDECRLYSKPCPVAVVSEASTDPVFWLGKSLANSCLMWSPCPDTHQNLTR